MRRNATCVVCAWWGNAFIGKAGLGLFRETDA